VAWTLEWLFGLSQEYNHEEKNMPLEWYLCFRCTANMIDKQTVIDVAVDPFDAVLAANDHIAEAMVERRHGFRPNEWVRAKVCETRTDEKFAAILNDAVTARIEEFERFMKLEHVVRARKEV
jgi:hypothetical protein